MVSLVEAIYLLNNFGDNVTLNELSSSLHVEFGDSKRIAATQSITLNHCLKDHDVEFLVINDLSVPILIGQTES